MEVERNLLQSFLCWVCGTHEDTRDENWLYYNNPIEFKFCKYCGKKEEYSPSIPTIKGD